MCNCNPITSSAFGTSCSDDSLVPDTAFNIEIPDCGCGGSGGGTVVPRPNVTYIYRDDSHWADATTYNQPLWSGYNFAVFFNDGNRYLTSDLDGFTILPGGGFTTDPSKFQLLDGQTLITIF